MRAHAFCERTPRSVAVWLLLLLQLALPCCASAPAPSAYSAALAPTSDHVAATREIVRALERDHYEHHPLDDRVSGMLFDRYLSELDPSRSCFTEKDVRDFEKDRFLLDDAVKTGRLDPAFAIYRRFQDSLAEQLLFYLRTLEKDFDRVRFDRDEYVETDRKDAPWPCDTGELRDLWRKRLTAAVLNLTLAGKTHDEARQILTKRFTAQLQQLRQATADDVFQTFMNALTRSYDPHTEYLAPRVSENFNISMSLSLEGIGAVLQNENEYTKIISLVPGGPADASKQLKPGDRIVGVGQGENGEIVNVVGWRIDEVVQRIRGPKQTLVRLEIIPADASDEHQTRVVAITRDTVKLEHQAASKKTLTIADAGRSRKIGVITIPTFYLDVRGQQAHAPDYRSTAQDVRRLLEQLRAERVDGIVLDLRDNGGGSLQEATLLLSMLLTEGPLVQVRAADGDINILRDTDPSILYDGPLAVLVNRLSASASEIVAAAVQDYRRGVVIGEQTFGKGTVQSLHTLRHGQLKLTQAKFYRVTGKSTQHDGVQPDIIYPSLHDSSRIGENTLPQALGCDAIAAAPFSSDPKLAGMLPLLRERFEARSARDPDYQYVRDLIGYLKSVREKTAVSLMEDIRRRENAEDKQRRREIENRRRAAKNLPLLAPDADPDGDNATRAPDRAADDDPVLRAAGSVIADMIALQQRR